MSSCISRLPYKQYINSPYRSINIITWNRRLLHTSTISFFSSSSSNRSEYLKWGYQNRRETKCYFSNVSSSEGGNTPNPKTSLDIDELVGIDSDTEGVNDEDDIDSDIESEMKMDADPNIHVNIKDLQDPLVEEQNETSFRDPLFYQRVWKSVDSINKKDEIQSYLSSGDFWTEPIRDPNNENSYSDPMSETRFKKALERIQSQEMEGGRMRERQLGVIREDPAEDMRLLLHNYTVPALASALRDREEVLQRCAKLLSQNKLSELSKTLRPFEKKYVNLRRLRKNNMNLDNGGFDIHSLEKLRKGLNRMPRQVSQAHQHRAGVVIPLCNVFGVPSILFEKRARTLRAHPDEVCLPGGMVSSDIDQSIASTCLREMQEEIPGIDLDKVVVLGVLRCNWGEVAQITGIAVTPLVAFIGEIGHLYLDPNPDEVSECFTVPLQSILKKELWIHKDNSAPIFTGGPHMIWGLTGYVIEKFINDVLARYSIQFRS